MMSLLDVNHANLGQSLFPGKLTLDPADGGGVEGGGGSVCSRPGGLACKGSHTGLSHVEVLPPFHTSPREVNRQLWNVSPLTLLPWIWK